MPLVSGTNSRQKKNTATRQPPNTQNAPYSDTGLFQINYISDNFTMLPPTPETRFVKNLVTRKARVQLVVVAMEEALDFTCSTAQYSIVHY